MGLETPPIGGAGSIPPDNSKVGKKGPAGQAIPTQPATPGEAVKPPVDVKAVSAPQAADLAAVIEAAKFPATTAPGASGIKPSHVIGQAVNPDSLDTRKAVYRKHAESVLLPLIRGHGGSHDRLKDGMMNTR